MIAKNKQRMNNEVVTSSSRTFIKNTKVIAYIKEKIEIKKVQKMTTSKIVKLTKNSNECDTLTTRKDIVAIKRSQRRLIFKVTTKTNKKIFENNDFWIKKISQKTTLREKQIEMMIHDVRIENLSKNIKNVVSKTLKKTEIKTKLNLNIKRAKWLTKNNENQKYVSLIMWMRSSKMINQMIQQEIVFESNIKTMKRYNVKTRIQQCCKCQNYDHNIYECKNKQKCAHCAKDHRSKNCSSIETKAK